MTDLKPETVSSCTGLSRSLGLGGESASVGGDRAGLGQGHGFAPPTSSCLGRGRVGEAVGEEELGTRDPLGREGGARAPRSQEPGRSLTPARGGLPWKQRLQIWPRLTSEGSLPPSKAPFSPLNRRDQRAFQASSLKNMTRQRSRRGQGGPACAFTPLRARGVNLLAGRGAGPGRERGPPRRSPSRSPRGGLQGSSTLIRGQEFPQNPERWARAPPRPRL